jgi:hypothetical protein
MIIARILSMESAGSTSRVKILPVKVFTEIYMPPRRLEIKSLGYLLNVVVVHGAAVFVLLVNGVVPLLV